MDDVLIIDAHCHVGRQQPPEWPWNDFESIIARVDLLGFDKVCTLGEHDYQMELLAKYPDWVIPCACAIHVHYPAHEIWAELERCHQAGFKCVGELAAAYPYMRYPVTGPNWRPVYEFAEKHNWSVSFHSDHSGGPEWCSPTAMGKVAEWYPSVPFIINHCGVDDPHGIEESIQVAMTHDNIYLEISSTAARYGTVEQLVSRLGSDRLMFATDGPALDFARELGQVAYARIPDADKENIFGLNFARLLHMRPEELKRKRPGDLPEN
ncbi:MAG: amidohydrolase family protein [Chloroflexota bacterium]